jgi:ParB family chromosome partitioning protein
MMAKKWEDPLDRLLAADEKASLSRINNKDKLKKTSISENSILELNVADIIRWQYKDRPENENGDISDLAETFKAIGQQQPCIARPSQEHPNKYELIVGERRWRAAEVAGLKLKVIVQNFDDKTAALIQAVENEKRKDISEFAKGMSYAEKIERGFLTQKDLINVLNISKQQVTRLLSYKQIPKALFDEISDFRNVSSKTAYELRRLSSKGEDHLNALIQMADKIREGKYGWNKIGKELDKALSQKIQTIPTNKRIVDESGRHLFTWRLDNNSNPSIHFPKDIIELINRNTAKFEELTKEFQNGIIKNLLSS